MSSTNYWHNEWKIDKSINRISSQKKILNIDWKFARKIIDEINNRSMNSNQTNIIVSRIQTVKNFLLIFLLILLLTLSFEFNYLRFRLHHSVIKPVSKKFQFRFLFVFFNNLHFFFLKWFFVCPEWFFRGFSFFAASNVLKNVVFKTISKSNFFNSGIQDFTTWNPAKKTSKKYPINKSTRQCSNRKFFQFWLRLLSFFNGPQCEMKKNVTIAWQKTNWKLSHITFLLNEMRCNDFQLCKYHVAQMQKILNMKINSTKKKKNEKNLTN